MPRKRNVGLTQRETEILGILWEKGPVSVDEISRHLEGGPAASTVRTLLGIMEERGLVKHDGQTYGKLYDAAVKEGSMQGSALRRLVDSFFAGSTEKMLLRLVDEGEVDLEQIKRLEQRIRQKRQED